MQLLYNTLTNPLLFWGSASVVSVFAVLAILAPHSFRRVATQSSTWVDTSRWLSLFDRQIEVDSVCLRYPRVFGAVLLGGLGVAVALFFLR